MTKIFNLVHQNVDSKKSAVFILVLVFFAILILQNDNQGFQKGHHGFLSSHGAAIAKNLSAKHYFLMFQSAWMAEDGSVEYDAYNRFPMTSFLMIKAVMNLYSQDLSMEIMVARQFMNLFMIGSIFLSYLILLELSNNPFLSLAATLLAFSSTYMNYYNDMIFNDIPTLFGFLLVFHGMAVHSKYSKRKQLFIKSLVGVSIGWQVLAAILSYIIVKTLEGMVKKRSVKAFFNKELFLLGLSSLILGISILSFNLMVEKLETGKNFSELSTIKSAKYRMGEDEAFNRKYSEYLNMGAFSRGQFHRIGAMTIPYLFMKKGDFALMGIVVLIIALSGLWFTGQRVLLSSFVLSGFLWAFPMRNFTVAHDFQSIYYIGIPLVVFYVILRFTMKKAEFLMPVIAVLSMLLFLKTNLIFNKSKASALPYANAVTEDFQRIINITGSRNLFYVDGDIHSIGGGYHAAEFYLAGNYFSHSRNAEYIISRNRDYSDKLLTPGNIKVFLFEGIPRFAGAYNRRGLEYIRKKDYQSAISDFSSAIEKNRNFVDAYANRGFSKKRLGNYGEAINDYNFALTMDPTNNKSLNALAWLLATCPEGRYRDGKRAVDLAEKTVAEGKSAFNLDTLAAAFAESKNFKKAVETENEAIELFNNKGLKSMSIECSKHLRSYMDHAPWRENE